ncbi:hypothetical protein OC842_003183 [Tilletia horrida]|uniref:Uncharacterized protein n=1 Tax=Tilletia horrida TaxID=155126 RepID=A0AAN6JKE5_9BASI|nr:hypothetical protein OC842_003183 [Tilletia horrida]
MARSSKSSSSSTASVGGTASSTSSGSSTRVSAASAKLTKGTKGTKAGPSSPLLTKSRLSLNTKLSKQQSSLSKAAAFSKAAASSAATLDEFDDADDTDFELVDEDRGARTSSDEDDSSTGGTTTDDDDDDDTSDEETSSDEDYRTVPTSKKRPRSSKKRNQKRRVKKSKRRKIADDNDDDDDDEFKLEMRSAMQKLLEVVKVVQHLAHVVEKLSSKVSETDSSVDSTYAKAIIKEPVITASSAEEYTRRTGVKLAQRVCWTEKEARAVLAAERQAEGIKGAVTATTPIPVATSTRTSDGEQVSEERLRTIWRIVREICKIFSACEDVRTPDEKGKITTRGIQYYRDHYQTVVDRVVELLEDRVEELRYCEDHWKALNFVCRRLKSLSEKDPRRDGVIAELARVKEEAAPEQAQQSTQSSALAPPAQLVSAKDNKGKATKGAPSRRRGAAIAAATAPASEDADLDELERRMTRPAATHAHQAVMASYPAPAPPGVLVPTQEQDSERAGVTPGLEAMLLNPAHSDGQVKNVASRTAYDTYTQAQAQAQAHNVAAAASSSQAVYHHPGYAYHYGPESRPAPPPTFEQYHQSQR